MKRSKTSRTSRATLKSPTQSSFIHNIEEIVLPPLDELSVCIKDLRVTGAGLDRIPHTVTVTFFNQLLINDIITPTGPRDQVEDLFSSNIISGTMSFDPSDYAKMCLFVDNPLIVQIQAADQSESVSYPSCCNVDILPLFQGETVMCVSKRMEPMIEPSVLRVKSWDNLPLIKMELRVFRNPVNETYHETINAANVMKMTLVAAYNLILPYNESIEYVAASKIRLSDESALGNESFKRSIPYPKRFSLTDGFYPRWESISLDNPFRKCGEKVSFNLDDVQNNENVNLNHYVNQSNQINTVVWCSFHRSLLLAGDEQLVSSHIRRYQWPVEFHMYGEENSYSFMGFLDLIKLLYPGETTVRLAVPLQWMDAGLMLEKCGYEPLLKFTEKTPHSTAAASVSKENDSAATDPTLQLPPTGADETPAFLIVEVTLARPLIKLIIPPLIPESEIKRMPYKRTEVAPVCTGRGQQEAEWRDTITSAAAALRRLPHYGITEHCSLNRQLSKTRTRIELATSFWQDAAVYVNNNFVVQDFVYSDNTFEEMIMMAHSCLMREASEALLGSEPEQDPTLRAARHARQLQDIEHATELYLRKVAENQNNENSWRELATCLMDQDVDLARVCINEALLLNPRHPLTLLSKGSMLYQEDPESAELFFKAILAMYPLWTSGWVIAQAFYIERQEFLMADKINECVKEIRGANMAKDLASERGWEKELGDWWYPTPLLPSTNQFLEAADLLLRLRAMPLAEVCLARALSSQGASAAYAHLVALAWRLRGEIDNALCHLDEGLKSFGETNYLRSLEAECLKKMKKPKSALTSFEKAGNCVNAYSILNALPGRDPQRARSAIVDLLRRQPSAYAWMALADDWLMRQMAAGKLGGAGDADAEEAMSACAAACAEQALRWDRTYARAWALLAQLAQPKARRAHCKVMATAFGYKWCFEECGLSGSQQSLCHQLGAALRECRCNLCETSDKADCAHLECECVKSVLL